MFLFLMFLFPRLVMRYVVWFLRHFSPLSLALVLGLGAFLWLAAVTLTRDARKRDVFEVVDVFSAACRAAGVPFFMYGRTLLGSWRHHALIPGESDVSLAVALSHKVVLGRALALAARRLSLGRTHVVLDTSREFRWKLSPATASFFSLGFRRHRPQFAVDIHFYVIDDSRVVDADVFYARRGFSFPVDAVFPLTYRPLEGRHLPSPGDARTLLQLTYVLWLCEVGPCGQLGFTCEHMACEDLVTLAPYVMRRELRHGRWQEDLVWRDRVINDFVWYIGGIQRF